MVGFVSYVNAISNGQYVWLLAGLQCVCHVVVMVDVAQADRHYSDIIELQRRLL